jgi:hypothetical protein
VLELGTTTELEGTTAELEWTVSAAGVLELAMTTELEAGLEGTG